MATFVFGMNLSLDGYVDHQEFAPGPDLFRHWIAQVRRATASVYGRRIYEIMRYWDEDRPEWTADDHAFAAACADPGTLHRLTKPLHSPRPAAAGRP